LPPLLPLALPPLLPLALPPLLPLALPPQLPLALPPQLLLALPPLLPLLPPALAPLAPSQLPLLFVTATAAADVAAITVDAATYHFEGKMTTPFCLRATEAAMLHCAPCRVGPRRVARGVAPRRVAPLCATDAGLRSRESSIGIGSTDNLFIVSATKAGNGNAASPRRGAAGEGSISSDSSISGGFTVNLFIISTASCHRVVYTSENFLIISKANLSWTRSSSLRSTSSFSSFPCHTNSVRFCVALQLEPALSHRMFGSPVSSEGGVAGTQEFGPASCRNGRGRQYSLTTGYRFRM